MRKKHTYRLHKGTGQAVVTIGGDTTYLGVYGTEASKQKYRRVLAEWKSQGGQRFRLGPDGLSVNEVLLAYVKAHKDYYRKDGRSTGELELVGYALRIVKELYGLEPAIKFGPLALKACRHEMIERDWSRKTINNQVGRIKRVFRWATENELAPPHVYQALRAVAGLRKGRSKARETEPIRPVPREHFEAVLPFLPQPVAAMAWLQFWSGMRSGEVTSMRTRDIDRNGKVWWYSPESHKTEHHGHEHAVPLGPRAQDVLRPFLKADPSAYLFSPQEAEAARKQALRKEGSRKKQRARRPRWKPGGRYTTRSHRRCIARACVEAGVPHWHPHQLRHNAATRYRREGGAEAAQVCLGHKSVRVTEIYAEKNLRLAAEVAARVG